MDGTNEGIGKRFATSLPAASLATETLETGLNAGTHYKIPRFPDQRNIVIFHNSDLAGGEHIEVIPKPLST